MAFLLPGLHSSALPDITVVITALSPRKLFTVSVSKTERVFERKWQMKAGKEKRNWEERKSQTARLTKVRRFESIELN